MRKLSLVALLALAGCGANSTDATTAVTKLDAKVQAAVAAVCAKDAQLQPMTAADMLVLGQMVAMVPAPQAQAASAAITLGTTVDTAAIHPEVVKLCATLAPAAQ
jgi:hypothetical protein